MHTATALAVARETGWNLDAHAADHGWTAVGMGPVGIHRDSDALARSNWDVTYPDMVQRFGDAVDSARFSHWAVGWVEEITWDAARADIAAYVAETRARLDDYPILDEMNYGELEWEENHPDDGRCYSDSPADCGCERPAA